MVYGTRSMLSLCLVSFLDHIRISSIFSMSFHVYSIMVHQYLESEPSIYRCLFQLGLLEITIIHQIIHYLKPLNIHVIPGGIHVSSKNSLAFGFQVYLSYHDSMLMEALTPDTAYPWQWRRPWRVVIAWPRALRNGHTLDMLWCSWATKQTCFFLKICLMEINKWE